MPKINENAGEQSRNPLAEQVEQYVPELNVVTKPVFFCGVNRKLGTGNFENIDLYAGLSIPLDGGSIEDYERLRELVEEAAKIGFELTSLETGQRYTALKEMQKGGRPEVKKT